MKNLFLTFIFSITVSSLCFGAPFVPPASGETGQTGKRGGGAIDQTTFFMTIEHNGQKTDVKYTQFKSHGGTTIPDGGDSHRLLLTYGASNDSDEKSFSFQGMIPAAVKGTYPMPNDGTSFTLMTSLFPNVPIFMVKSGTYEITAVPQKGGFVEGTFSVVCDNVKDDGSVETYTINGSFKLLRQ
jgi:hypothetical protein